MCKGSLQSKYLHTEHGQKSATIPIETTDICWFPENRTTGAKTRHNFTALSKAPLCEFMWQGSPAQEGGMFTSKQQAEEIITC